MGCLKKKFDAESYYMLTTTTKAVQTDAVAVAVCQVKVEDKAVQTDINVPLDILSDTAEFEGCLQLQSLSLKYASLCQDYFGLEVPNDFLVYSGAAMV